MLKAGVCQLMQSSGVVIFYALLQFAFNSCIVELYTQDYRSQGTVFDVLADDGFHM